MNNIIQCIAFLVTIIFIICNEKRIAPTSETVSYQTHTNRFRSETHGVNWLLCHNPSPNSASMCSSQSRWASQQGSNPDCGFKWGMIGLCVQVASLPRESNSQDQINDRRQMIIYIKLVSSCVMSGMKTNQINAQDESNHES